MHKTFSDSESALGQQSYENVVNTNDANEAYDTFLNTFTTIFKKHCPVKKVSIKHYINKKPWFTNGLKRACAKKKKLYKAFILSRSAESEHKYKTYKNKLTSILRLTEKMYYSTLLEQQRNNVKGTWKILNKVINKKYNKPTYPEYFLKNNKRISKKEDIANGFNFFFFTHKFGKKYPIT